MKGNPLRRRRCPPHDSRRAGFTLYEVMIYILIISLLGAPIVSVVLASTRFISEVDSFTKVQERNRSALYRVEREVRRALRTTVTVNVPGTSLGLTLANDYDGSAIVAGDQILYRFLPAPDDPQNGADDNGNGLVDEGVLIRRNLDTNERVTICGGVDLANSGFVLNGTEVTINLTTAGVVASGGDTFSISSSLVVYPYN